MITTRTALDALIAYLGKDPFLTPNDVNAEVAEIIADCCLGAELLDPRGKRLMRDFFNTFPEPDNISDHEVLKALEGINENIAALFAEAIDEA